MKSYQKLKQKQSNMTIEVVAVKTKLIELPSPDSKRIYQKPHLFIEYNHLESSLVNNFGFTVQVKA